ncbi:hypothetical protein AVU32_gp187 [Vibrio phage ValKK3]|uniref:Uncharacterized protein n=1 Tax=Vibrio phage ValKK3 TaxID=1610855 RepID=A0A0D4DBV6_9CAUD|nr:hypothetical protein AVU32_gp187 [Vibrio phage ValKK3]AJT61028.1 hypothetical protein [Vibrio phage ValKK3]
MIKFNQWFRTALPISKRKIKTIQRSEIGTVVSIEPDRMDSMRGLTAQHKQITSMFVVTLLLFLIGFFCSSLVSLFLSFLIFIYVFVKSFMRHRNKRND